MKFNILETNFKNKKSKRRLQTGELLYEGINNKINNRVKRYFYIGLLVSTTIIGGFYLSLNNLMNKKLNELKREAEKMKREFIITDSLFNNRIDQVGDSLMFTFSIKAYVVNLTAKRVNYSDSITIDSIPASIREDSLYTLLDRGLDRLFNTISLKIDSLLWNGNDVELWIVISNGSSGQGDSEYLYFEFSASEVRRKRGLKI